VIPLIWTPRARLSECFPTRWLTTVGTSRPTIKVGNNQIGPTIRLRGSAGKLRRSPEMRATPVRAAPVYRCALLELLIMWLIADFPRRASGRFHPEHRSLAAAGAPDYSSCMAKRVCYIHMARHKRHKLDPVGSCRRTGWSCLSMAISCRKRANHGAHHALAGNSADRNCGITNSRGHELCPSTRPDSVRSGHCLLGGLKGLLRNRDYAKAFFTRIEN